MPPGHFGKSLGAIEQPIPARGLGPAMGGPEHAVEDLDREIGERGLALDHEGREGGEAPLGQKRKSSRAWTIFASRAMMP